jgi:hypothetical protein
LPLLLGMTTCSLEACDPIIIALMPRSTTSPARRRAGAAAAGYDHALLGGVRPDHNRPHASVDHFSYKTFEPSQALLGSDAIHCRAPPASSIDELQHLAASSGPGFTASAMIKTSSSATSSLHSGKTSKLGHIGR